MSGEPKSWRYDVTIRPAPHDIYISADVETDGPIPGPFSMLSLGLCVAGRFDGKKYEAANPRTETLYLEMSPISDRFEPEALEVNGLDRKRLIDSGTDPKSAMNRASQWVKEISVGYRPVLVAYPVAFDWAFINWYFVSFADRGSPFGYASCLDIRSLYQAKSKTLFERSGKRDMPEELRSQSPHSHNALDDSIEQAELFSNVFDWTPSTDDNFSDRTYIHP